MHESIDGIANTFARRNARATTSDFAVPCPVPTGLDWFNHVFRSAIAETAEERNECFRARFQVYCVDNKFEDPNANPGGLETDAHDNHCVHSLLTHRATGDAIGTVRIVLPYSGSERRPLPIQMLAGAPASDALAPFPVHSTAEISRFAIVKSFHQYIPDRGIEASLPAHEWRTLLLHLPLGLVKSCLEMSVLAGISHWTAVLEPSLLRLLARIGLHMHPLGDLVEHHGRRQPCWVEIDALLRHVLHERPDVWKLLTDNGRINPRMNAAPAH